MESIHIDELNKLMNNNSFNDLEAYLRQVVDLYKTTNNISSKKNLKLFFPNFLSYICNNVDIQNAHNVLSQFHQLLLDLCLHFQDNVNEFFKKLLEDLHKIVTAKTDFKENKIFLINSALLIIYLTNKINQPNQYLTNYIFLINLLLQKIDINLDDEKKDTNLIIKMFFLTILEYLSVNTKSYNPFLYNQLEYMVYHFQFFFENNKITIPKAKKGEEIHILNLLNKSKVDHGGKISLCYIRLLTITYNLMDANKDEMNFDVIFRNIVDKVIKINDFVEVSKDNSESLLVFYKQALDRCIDRKNIQINFLTIKKKPIPSLDPEYEYYPDILNGSKEKDLTKMPKILKKKLRMTKRQAIRNLKKEARVIDSERQKRNKKLAVKKREEQKVTNQFIEQTNQEYKTMMTSNPKKRFKLKKK